jgi:hypothetical protein
MALMLLNKELLAPILIGSQALLIASTLGASFIGVERIHVQCELKVGLAPSGR